MSLAASVVTPRSGAAAVASSVNSAGDVMQSTGFDFALKKATSRLCDEGGDANFDRLVDHLYREAHHPEAVKQSAAAMRRTVETSLWQSARRIDSRLPHIHAEIFGKTAALYVAERLSRLALGFREWLVLLSSPRRFGWGVQAAWRGDDVAQSIQEKAAWYRVEDVVVYEHDRRVPIVRVGDAVAENEGDWLASNPVFCVTKRYLAGRRDSFEEPSDDRSNEQPVQAIVVVGKLVEIVARIVGHPPAGYRQELQAVCDAADAIIADHEAGRAEQVFRLKQAVAPALRTKEATVARQFWNPLIILASTLTLGAVLLGAAGVEHLRWQGIVNEVDAAPGIEVISGSIAWGHRQLEVLRDPCAASIFELLLRAGCDPLSVTIRERPFLSADEAMMAGRKKAARASTLPVAATAASPTTADEDALRRELLADVRLDLVRSTLDLPQNVELSFENGELAARGALAEPGWSRLANAPKRFAWIKSLNLDQLRDLTGENIAKVQSSLEKYSIEFAPVSAVLPEASKLRLQSVSSELRMLAHDAVLKRQSTRVQFRVTDPSIDQATAEARVALIRRDLERQGVPGTCFTPSGGHLDAPRVGAVGFHIVLEPLSDEP